MADFLGPANADGAVIVRPVNGRTFGAVDTWIKDCTDPDIDDGTEIRADLLNDWIANMRSIARCNGATLADPTIKVVAESGGDDGILLKAIQHLIQRGQVNYALASGTANALSVTLNPVPPELKAGLVVLAKIITANTGAVTLNVNGLGDVAVVSPGGAALQAGELAPGMVAEFTFDGATFQFLSGSANRRKRLAANLDLYVATTGSNSNPGTSALPFATLQRAYDYIQLGLDLNGYTVTVHVADGAYAGGVGAYGAPPPGQKNAQSIVFVGNLATPANVVISVTNDSCFVADGGAQFYIQGGFTLNAAGGTAFYQGNGICAADNGFIIFQGVIFGACASSHISTVNGGEVQINGSYGIAGSAPTHYTAARSGSGISTVAAGIVVTLTATPAFSAAFASAFECGTLTLPSITFSGSATGPRYNANQNGVIATGGAGVNYFPGNTAGSTSTGGQYT